MNHEDILKLCVAAALGILVGLERELKRKPLGLKTCLVISVSSCLLTIVSVETSFMSNAVAGVVRSDPMRLAAQVVSGIGFLGAGVILHKRNEVIAGLTTAAMVWASSGLGIAVGAGFYLDAVVGLFLIIVSVEIVPSIMRRIGPKVLREKEVEVSLLIREGVRIPDIIHKMSVLESRLDTIKTSERADGMREVLLLCIVDKTIPLSDLFLELEDIDGVVSVCASAVI